MPLHIKPKESCPQSRSEVRQPWPTLTRLEVAQAAAALLTLEERRRKVKEYAAALGVEIEIVGEK